MSDHGEGVPYHNLDDVKTSVEIGHFEPTRKVRDELAELEMDRRDLKECLLQLRLEEFRETRDSDKEAFAGAKLDIYLTSYNGQLLYVKYCRGVAGRLVIISFHEARY